MVVFVFFSLVNYRIASSQKHHFTLDVKKATPSFFPNLETYTISQENEELKHLLK